MKHRKIHKMSLKNKISLFKFHILIEIYLFVTFEENKYHVLTFFRFLISFFWKLLFFLIIQSKKIFNDVYIFSCKTLYCRIIIMSNQIFHQLFWRGILKPKNNFTRSLKDEQITFSFFRHIL